MHDRLKYPQGKRAKSRNGFVLLFTGKWGVSRYTFLEKYVSVFHTGKPSLHDTKVLSCTVGLGVQGVLLKENLRTGSTTGLNNI